MGAASSAKLTLFLSGIGVQGGGAADRSPGRYLPLPCCTESNREDGAQPWDAKEKKKVRIFWRGERGASERGEGGENKARLCALIVVRAAE